MRFASRASWVGAQAVLASEPAQLLPAREQMAFTLGFHIILVPFGVAFTFLMMLANYRGIRRGDSDALVLAERRSKVAAVLFAVGAVSGTVLSFELGLLWPVAAREVFHKEPAKFATMEMLSVTGDHVPERLLGVLSSDGKVRYGLSIPSGVAARRVQPVHPHPGPGRASSRTAAPTPPGDPRPLVVRRHGGHGVPAAGACVVVRPGVVAPPRRPAKPMVPAMRGVERGGLGGGAGGGMGGDRGRPPAVDGGRPAAHPRRGSSSGPWPAGSHPDACPPPAAATRCGAG
jgi:hypothetical protein